MQSKQVAVAGILTGAVMTGLGVIVLLAGLAEADRPDRDPVTGYEDVGNPYPDVDPLPSLPPSGASERPDTGSSTGWGGSEADPGETYGPRGSGPTETASPGGTRAPREPEAPAESAGPTPTSGPTGTAEPEPSSDPTASADPTSDPTPTETATPTTEP
ncbi:hypothetical protein [Nocardioides luteus]|uniref:Uncharacterized protein n=1 Tax=Nocardioides luteus TaxID=1844 RepID=A0A1J4MX08_9ACTN|nr:hypothetical protein [Nocardioides luteus]OIJ23810.1 hypothetical protein UG56_026145 [Nocardioides luteus]